MIVKNKVLCLAAVTMMASCSLKEGEYQKAYLDMDSLVTAQVQQLASASLKVEKKARISNEEATTTTPLNGLAWEKELEIFRQLDAINKPTFRNAYRVEELKDSRSNLSIRSYTATQPASIPVIRFFYLGRFANLKKIEARVEETNALFNSVRNLTLEFEEVDQQPRVAAYGIFGFQKMLLADTVKFSIEARVVH